MRRIIIALCLFLAASPAMGADNYVDNTLIYTGTAVGSGTTTTIVMNAAFTASGIAGGALVDNDPRIRYMGLFVTGGTGASQNHHKISDYNATTHTITFATALSGSSDNTTAFDITYGCNSNTGLSATVGATNVGPKLTIQVAYENIATGETCWVKASNQPYTEREQSSAAQQYLRFWRNVANLRVEGYVTTPGDLNTNPSSTRIASSAAAYGATAGKVVDVAAGYAVGQLTMPIVKPLDPLSFSTTYIDVANTITIRGLWFQSAEARIVGVNDITDGSTITFDQCKFGDGLVASQIGIIDLQTADIKSLVVSKCWFYTRNSNIFSRQAVELTITDNHMVCYNADGTSKANVHIVSGGTSPGLTYDSSADEWYANNQVRRLKIDSNRMLGEQDATFGNGIVIVDSGGSSTVGPSWMEHAQITRNRIETTRASPISVVGLPSFEIGYNELYTNSSSGGGSLISLSPDAIPTTDPASQLRKIIRRAVVAGGASGSVTLDASASATNNAYRYRKVTVYKADGTAVQTRPLSGYTGATKIATYAVDGLNATMSPTPASGDIFEIWEERPQTQLVHDNYTKHLQDVSANTHGFLIGQGYDGVRIWNNTIINSDNGIVAKGNYLVIFNNKISAGCGAMLVKGGSWGTVLNNTFETRRAQGGAACLDIQDKSSVAVSVATPSLFRDKWSKASGWVFLNTIFSVKGIPTFCINDNQADVGTFMAPAAQDPAAQRHYFNFNVYAMDANADGTFDGGVSNPLFYMNGANVNTVALQRTQWADTSYQKTFNLYQDESSREGSILFRSTTTGDFAIVGGTAAGTVGSDGHPIGHGRPARKTSPFIFTP